MATIRRRRLGIAFIIVGLLMAGFSSTAGSVAGSGGGTSTTSTTSTSQASLLVLSKDTGGNLLSGQVIVDGVSYPSGTTFSVAQGQHTVSCGPITGYIPVSPGVASGYASLAINGPTTVVCLYNPQSLPQYSLTITAKDANGNTVNAPISINGSSVGTGTATVTLNQGKYQISCGAAQGYTVPNPFTVYLSYSLSTTCLYVSPTASQTTLTVLVQFYSTSTKQYYPLSAVNVKLSDGQSKITDSAGKAVFAVSQNIQYIASVTNSGYGDQSKTVQVGTTGQATTITFATSGFTVIGKVGPYDVTSDNLTWIGIALVVLGIIIAL